MYQLVISFQNEKDLLEKITQIVNGIQTTPVATAPKKAAKKTAAKEAEQLPLPMPEVSTPTSGTSAPAISKEEVLKHLQQVNEVKGLEAAKKVLAVFNCQRISEIQEAAYPSFIEECKKALL